MARCLLLPAVLVLLAGADSPAPPQKLTVTGKVVDAAGKPVAGATVYLREWATYRRSERPHAKDVQDILARTTTDEQGGFAFRDVAAPAFEAVWANRGNPWDVVATAKGHGLGWKHLPSPRPQPLTVTLTPEASLRGRVHDADKKPVAGTRVQIAAISRLQSPFRQGSNTEGHLDLGWSQLPLIARTDADGQFVLTGLPKEMRVALVISDERFVREPVYAATTEQPQPPIQERTYADGKPTTRDVPVHVGELDISLRPGYRLTGRVTLESNGQPAANARVMLMRGSQSFDAATDKEGRYTLSQMSADKYQLWVWPPEGVPALRSRLDVMVTTEPAQTLDVRLPAGVTVTGQVVDEETGRGVAGVTVMHTLAKADKDWRHSAWTAKTDGDGRFRLAVPPGPGRILVSGVPHGYLGPALLPIRGTSSEEVNRRFLQDIDVKPDQAPPEVKFTLGRGLVVTGQVTGPDGKPVRGAEVRAAAQQPWRVDLAPSATTDADGRFALTGLQPDQIPELTVTSRERKLAAKVAVPAAREKGKPIDLPIKLEPTGAVAGRVLDEQQKPMAGASVQLWIGSGQGYFTSSAETFTTDAEGRFRLDTLSPGSQYYVQATSEGFAGTQAPLFEAKSGETHTLTDLVLVKADQSLAGTVVDPTGKPIPGVQVYIHGDRGNVVLSTQNQIVTDRDGRFRATGLPRGGLRLYAQEATTDGTAQTPASTSLRVEAGKQDVRLVLFTSPPKQAEATTRQPAPDFPVQKWLHRSGADGRAFSRDDFRGKVVLLAFVDEAKPSQRLLPRLNQLHEQFADKGLVIVRVYEATDAEEELTKPSPTAAALVAGGLVPGGYSEAFRKYAVRATPTLFLIDRQGVLRYADIEAEALTDRLREMLKP